MNQEIKTAELTDPRILTEGEMDEVAGGLLPLLLGALGFAAGFVGGEIAANDYYAGNFWGDLDL